MVKPVDTGVQFVADLEGAVVGGGGEVGVVGPGEVGGVGVGRGVDGGRAGVHDAGDLVFQGEGGLEDGEGSEDVHAGAEQGIGAAGGDLEAG